MEDFPPSHCSGLLWGTTDFWVLLFSPSRSLSTISTVLPLLVLHGDLGNSLPLTLSHCVCEHQCLIFTILGEGVSALVIRLASLIPIVFKVKYF